MYRGSSALLLCAVSQIPAKLCYIMADECAMWEAQLNEERNKQEAEIFAACKYSTSVTA